MRSGLDELLLAPAWRQREAIVAGHVSVVELVRATLERIAALDPLLHTFTSVAPDAAVRDAERLDAELRNGIVPGTLFGVAVSVKDLFHVAGMRTSAGSLVFEDHVAEA